MLFPIVILLCLTALANLLSVINFCPVPNHHGNNKMCVLLTYLACWLPGRLLLPTRACGLGGALKQVYVHGGCSPCRRHLVACRLLIKVPPVYGILRLGLPGIFMLNCHGTAPQFLCGLTPSQQCLLPSTSPLPHQLPIYLCCLMQHFLLLAVLETRHLGVES